MKKLFQEAKNETTFYHDSNLENSSAMLLPNTFIIMGDFFFFKFSFSVIFPSYFLSD